MEGSRVVSGCFASGLHMGDSNISGHLKNLIYTVEVACGRNLGEKAIRFAIFDQKTQQSLVNVLFADKSLLERDQMTVLEDARFAIRSGFADSLAIVQKMSCLNYDYRRYELNQEIKAKLNDGKAVDLMRDFKQATLPQPASETSIPAKPNEEEEAAFVTLSKLKQKLLQNSLKNQELLYRKNVVRDKGKTTLTISAFRETNFL